MKKVNCVSCKREFKGNRIGVSGRTTAGYYVCHDCAHEYFVKEVLRWK